MALAGLAAGLALPGAERADARVDPVNYIEQQIKKANVLLVLDTSGSMNTVPASSWSNANEVGVDCDNGFNCRGWGLSGECTQTGRPCATTADCQVGFCAIGGGSCSDNSECPSEGTCQHGNYFCTNDGDCAAFGVGRCSRSGGTCATASPCPSVGACRLTGDLCTDVGRRCTTGTCSNAAGRLCQQDADCTLSPTGSCEYGATPAGGCRTDTDCPAVGTCSTGESCMTSSDCPRLTTGRCSRRGNSCTSNAQCTRANEVCNIPSNTCTMVSNRCVLPTGTCNRSNQNMCDQVQNTCSTTPNACVIVRPNRCEPAPATDTCSPSATAGTGALKMCQLGQRLCSRNSDCTLPGDTCGPPTSRTVIAKRILSKVVTENSNIVNFGFMTFYQGNYFPYFEIANPTPSTERVFLTKGALEGPCWSHAGGPTSTCRHNGADYTLVSGVNSRYQVQGAQDVRQEHDAAWCGQFCQIPGAGTGRYLGSYYTRAVITGTPTSTRKVFATYQGKFITDNGKHYRYYDAPPTLYNGHGPPPIATVSCGSQCSATCGARWDTQLSPFMRPEATLAEADAFKRAFLAAMEPASYGGLITYAGTPSGCTLQNSHATNVNASVYHYMQSVKASDPVTCRQNYVLFVTDGEANGPGDSSCSAAACAASDPEAAGCTCRVVLSAYRLRRQLGVKTMVVGFSADVAVGTPRIVNDNVARAGGTDAGNDGVAPFAYMATNENELLRAIQGAIYDAARGTYSTSPSTSSSGKQLSNTIRAGKYILDARVDFPSWKGHLLAYDTTQNPPVVAWDAAVELERMRWWERRIYLGTHDGNVIKVLVDPGSKAVQNKVVIHQLGLGADPDEAERMVRFIMGDPTMGNPAILGAMINSTPIDVAEPGDSPLPGGRAFYLEHKDRPALTYVGANDGMLHAFFTEQTSIGGLLYPAGSEAFAYVPPGMLDVIAKLYVQRGQVADPARHIHGLANSPKVRNLCVMNCDDAQTALWKTLLVMGEGFGGDGVFMLDITNPVSESGFAEPPVRPIWHSRAPALQSSYTQAMGLSISVPAFYFQKTPQLDDYRVIFASGYRMPGGPTSQGRRVVSAGAVSGEILGSWTATPPSSCAQEYALLTDVATARDHGAGEYSKLRAAYAGDTWGNLWRYNGSAMTRLKSFGCEHPLHFAPTVVQLDRDDHSNHPGLAYVVQVTNSALDDDTLSLPPSRMIIFREKVDDSGNVVPDTSFGVGGELVLNVGNDAHICGVTRPNGTCAVSLPTVARPTSTPLAILKRDGSGFQMISMWYAPDATGCSKGTTWLALHEVVGQQVRQVQGVQVANEPVTSPVIAGGRIFVVGSNGTIEITGNLEATFSTGTSSPVANIGVGNFTRLSWTEIE